MYKTLAKPSLLKLLRLRCPYCGTTKLLQPGSWFAMTTYCEICEYRLEREVGYFTGASWVMNYFIAAVFALLAGAVTLWLWPSLNDFLLAGIPALVGGLASFLIIPHSKALWIYFDHLLHPISADDRPKKDFRAP